jgi:hypothetical protein
VSGVEVGYRFAMIPEWILYHEDLSPLAIRLYGALARHGMDPATCYPSHARLAMLCHLEERSVAIPLRQLVDVGAVQITRRAINGRRTSNGYRLAGDAPLVYRAQERGWSGLQPRSQDASYRAPERVEGEPPNETPTYISTDTQDARCERNPEVVARLERLNAYRASKNAPTHEGTPTP